MKFIFKEGKRNNIKNVSLKSESKFVFGLNLICLEHR